MRCDEARLLISVGLDGELTGQPAAGLQNHLAECALCQQERAALASTVQLLHALPEADPPAELRRRIGVALLEEERRAARRRLGWAWLARPGTAGWAWGAAAGAAIVSIALFTTQGANRASRVAVAPAPPAALVPSAPLVRPASPTVKAAADHRLVVSGSKQPPSPRIDAPKIIAVAPPSPAPSIEAPPVLPVEAPPVVRRAPAAHSRAHRRQHPSVRNSPPAAAAVIARGTSAREDKITPRPVSADREAPRVAWMNQPSPADSSMANSPDVDESSDSSTMTDMASMPMPAPATEPKDDLADLRHRLTDRPLQAPELGRVKPSDRQDGWIRF